MNEETQEKVNNLSILEQNMQHLSSQRQSFQTQLLEIESAFEELNNSKEAYKIIGSIMVKTDALKLKEELDSKKKLIEIRIKSVEKQEDAIKQKSKKLQDEIMASINEINNAGSKEKESNISSGDKKEKTRNKNN